MIKTKKYKCLNKLLEQNGLESVIRPKMIKYDLF